MDSDEDSLFPVSVYINSEFEESLVGMKLKDKEGVGMINHVLSEKSEIN